jgi:hypothetical protein
MTKKTKNKKALIPGGNSIPSNDVISRVMQDFKFDPNPPQFKDLTEQYRKYHPKSVTFHEKCLK